MAFSLKSFNVLNILHNHKYFSNFTAEILHRKPFFDRETFASGLEICPNIDSLKKLHACLITRGLEADAYLNSKLINSLARFNLLYESRYVFNKIIDGGVSLCNSVASGYFRANQYGEVLGVYLSLRRRNVEINHSSIVFALKSCVELGNYGCGMNIHLDCFKSGLNVDQFVCSSLIGFYSKFDQIRDARKVFEEMPERDVVAYTSIITAYARAGNHYAANAFTAAIEMQNFGFQPNRVTLVSLLQCVSQFKDSGNAKSIHSYAIRRGITSEDDEVFNTSLMDLYIKLGNLQIGSIIFNTMKMKSTSSWNALIAGLLQSRYPLEALNQFHQMVSKKYSLDLVSFANGLGISADLGHLLLGKSFHCRIIRERVNLDLVGTTALIDMYCKCRHLSAATNVFTRADHKDGVLFGVMLAGYLYNGFIQKAMEMFHEMINLCINLSVSTVINILSALSDLRDDHGGKSVHGYMLKRCLEMNTDISNQFISMYSKFGLIRYAKLVFGTIRHKDTVSWTSLIAVYANHGLADVAIASFRQMQKENICPDSITFTSLLQAVNQLGSISLTREIHGYLHRMCLEQDVMLINALITVYTKWGKLKSGVDLFNRMPQKDLSSYNTMIAAYGMNGDCNEALALFNRMKKTNICPDGTTFKSILSACSHGGYVREGLDVFNSMEKGHGIIPSDEHYNCIVDMLGRAGRLEEAYEVAKQCGNGSGLGALMAACRSYGDLEMGEGVGKLLLDAESGRVNNASAYCSVSNFYAGIGKWDAVASIGAVAEEKGLKRITGYSVVDVTVNR